jgi:hypothetical protein
VWLLSVLTRTGGVEAGEFHRGKEGVREQSSGDPLGFHSPLLPWPFPLITGQREEV